ncbi:uncharacterized protein LOC111410334 isoform X2 [Olea europaea var. sylvestris]|uniref:uncharacterized protein LOC111410334 isoform X2 n=1 Tax=Olea europaea var. sylvestris TaxID=158386 RepID=UPI000C1D326F|nr:uncharacterized protein LOC111410334 isoform X2 [Olea europaea var. sylvestris]
MQSGARGQQGGGRGGHGPKMVASASASPSSSSSAVSAPYLAFDQQQQQQQQRQSLSDVTFLLMSASVHSRKGEKHSVICQTVHPQPVLIHHYCVPVGRGI